MKETFIYCDFCKSEIVEVGTLRKIKYSNISSYMSGENKFFQIKDRYMRNKKYECCDVCLEKIDSFINQLISKHISKSNKRS